MHRRVVVAAIGLAQIFAWGTTFYLPAVLSKPINDETGWPLAWIVGGLSLAFIASGIAAPYVGKQIAQLGGRLVLATSTAFNAVGLLGLAIAGNLAVYLIAWLFIGIGMAAGLYDAAFATLGRLYGQNARQAIATVTLFGGLASTVCWPLSAYLAAHFGWRETCLIYAAAQISVLAPLYLFCVPREERPAEARHEQAANGASETRTLAFLLLSISVALSAGVSSVVSVHLLTILQASGISLAAAVAFGTLVGPSQVAARAIEMTIARFHHPIWTLLTATILMAAGLGLLWLGQLLISVSLMLYGAGIGIYSIARGTLPLAVFGDAHYPQLMGRLARPALIASAVSPTLAAWPLESFGAGTTVAMLAAFATVNAAISVALVAATRSRRKT